jgi:RNA polymerase sigma-70 factor (ECF subfamily)
MDDSKLEFQEIYTSFQPKILHYLNRLVGDVDAEDLTQDVFVKVAAGLEDFRGESALSTWIYRIATNTAMDRLRNPVFKQEDRNCHPDCSLDDDEPEIADLNAWTGEKQPQVENQIYHEEMNACLFSHVMKLPEACRTVLILSEYKGLSNSEIAAALGVTLDTVKIRLHRARKQLKEHLSVNCGFYWVEDNEFLPELNLS